VVKSLYEIARSADLAAEEGLDSTTRVTSLGESRRETRRDPTLPKPETQQV